MRALTCTIKQCITTLIQRFDTVALNVETTSSNHRVSNNIGLGKILQIICIQFVFFTETIMIQAHVVKCFMAA